MTELSGSAKYLLIAHEKVEHTKNEDVNEKFEKKQMKEQKQLMTKLISDLEAVLKNPTV